MNEEYLDTFLENESALAIYFKVPIFKIDTRYRIESDLIAELSKYALNKPKNINKPRFEDLPYQDIRRLLKGEIKELEEELKKDDLDYKRILDELADVLACCTGLLVKTLYNNNYWKPQD